MENWTEEHILASDLWGVDKNLTPYASPEEELEAWERTVKVLDHLAGMAEALAIAPLIQALVDAKVRAGAPWLPGSHTILRAARSTSG